MRISRQNQTLNISEVVELAAGTAKSFHRLLEASLPAGVSRLQLDLSHTTFLDCAGLGSLIAFRNSTRQHNQDFDIQLLNPSPSVSRILELTQMQDIFPIQRQ
jgi:anti-anti-sigma factor